MFGSYKKIVTAIAAVFSSAKIDISAIDFEASDAAANLEKAIGQNYVSKSEYEAKETELANAQTAAAASETAKLQAANKKAAEFETSLKTAESKLAAYETAFGPLDTAAAAAPQPAAAGEQPTEPTAEEQAKALEAQAAALRSTAAASELARADLAPIELGANGADDEATTPEAKLEKLNAAYVKEADPVAAEKIYQKILVARRELKAAELSPSLN